MEDTSAAAEQQSQPLMAPVQGGIHAAGADADSSLCLYGGDGSDDLEALLFSVHAFRLPCCLAVAFILLPMRSLQRFHARFWSLVTVCLVSFIVGSALYLLFYPYPAVDDGNCLEMIVSRLATGTHLLSELFQVYVLIFVLGLDRRRVHLLVQDVRLPTLVGAVAVVVAAWALLAIPTKGLLVLHRPFGLLFALVQIRLIRVALGEVTLGGDFVPNQQSNLAVDPKTDSLFAVFRHLTSIAVILWAVTTFRSLLAYFGWNPDLGAAARDIDTVCIILFFLKTIIIAERVKSVQAVVVPVHEPRPASMRDPMEA